jgi:hypothetical protein
MLVEYEFPAINIVMITPAAVAHPHSIVAYDSLPSRRPSGNEFL